MPPRLITLGIVLFWVSMTCWLIVREVVPILMAEDSPTVQVDLTDRINAAPVVGWTVFKREEGKKPLRIGSGTSRIIVDEADEWFEFRSAFLFEKLTLAKDVQAQQLENMYRVTKDGQLKSLSFKCVVKTVGIPIDVSMNAEVIEGMLEPRLTHPLGELKFEKFPIKQGNVINPMHLVNKLRGLREGQTWKVTLIDPFDGLKEKFMGKHAGSMPVLIAMVKADMLTWDKRPVACYKIEYFEPGKDVTARTWARKIDGLVLQQEASHLGFDMVLERVPSH